MNDFFGQVCYEYDFLYHNVYSPVIYNNNFYTYFGILMILVPLVVLAIFYFINKNPYGKLWHWIIALVVSAVLVIGISYNMLNEELATYVLDPSNYPDASGFVMNLSFFNLVYSMVVGFAISFIYKQVPGPQSTLPFSLKKK